MMGTGMTLEKQDFTNVLSNNWISVPMGILCQFIIMPISAFLVGHFSFLFRQSSTVSASAALYLGLILVGCSPGGTASNLVSLIAGADLALSVLLTACSTIMASFVTPLLVQLLMRYTLPNPVLGNSMASVQVHVSGLTLCTATAKVVLGPVLLGMLINSKFPRMAKSISRFTPFASVVLVALICGGVVAQNVSTMVGTGSMSLLPTILKAVLCLHTIGFMVGYLVPKAILFARHSRSNSNTKDDTSDITRNRERTSRTISIETGMQNSALAVVLARSIGADPLASLPGALSATVHSCLGSILAAYWRFQDNRSTKTS